MLVKIDNTVINTDKIITIDVDPNGKFVRIKFTDSIVEKFSFPNHESQDSFLRKIGLETYFA